MQTNRQRQRLTSGKITGHTTPWPPIHPLFFPPSCDFPLSLFTALTSDKQRAFRLDHLHEGSEGNSGGKIVTRSATRFSNLNIQWVELNSANNFSF